MARSPVTRTSGSKTGSSRKEPLRQIGIAVAPMDEETVSALLESEFGQQAGIYTDAATGVSTVSVYAPVTAAGVPAIRARLTAAISALRAAGNDLQPGRLSIRTVPPEDWSESWKRHFKPIDIGPSLLVKPTWSRRAPKRGQQVVLLDPGLSFGTGQHATTHFCLTQVAALRKAGTAPTLMDMGTGSGILAIAAAKLGYARVEAFDFDPDCVRITAENAALNQVGKAVRPYIADVTKLPAKTRDQFDVVCANLISDLLVAHRQRILARVRPGGSLVLAGILATQFAGVAAAYGAAGWKVVRAKTDREWRSGLFRRA
jgi:ribosomal protein L11 methyltransferase